MATRKECATKRELSDRALLTAAQSSSLERLFKTLANDTRLRLLHALIRSEELCVNDLASALHMKPQAVSNQLQKLVERGFLESRRDSVQVFYRIVDPCVEILLDRGLCLLEDAGRL